MFTFLGFLQFVVACTRVQKDFHTEKRVGDVGGKRVPKFFTDLIIKYLDSFWIL
jgi:hypothetical protein